MDQTPKPSNIRPDTNRTRTELSPSSKHIIEENTRNRIRKNVEKSKSNSAQNNSGSEELATTADQTNDTQRNEILKRKIMEEIQQQIQDSRHDDYSKTLSESELFESYNRRDNIRTIGLKVKTKIDNQIRIVHESVDVTKL